MIGTYRKKPVTVSAIEWTGNNAEEIRQFCGAAAEICIIDDAWKVGKCHALYDLRITTLEGQMHASVGDFVIRGVNGEFYPCKPDVFHKTYEEPDTVDAVPVEEFERLKLELQICRNELCLHCGNYKRSHLGACNGCRWKDGEE